jgi:hypothetical protein
MNQDVLSFVISKNYNFVQEVSVLNVVGIPDISSLPTSKDVRCVIFDSNVTDKELKYVRREFPTAFITIFDPNAIDKPHYRIAAFETGANQIVCF